MTHIVDWIVKNQILYMRQSGDIFLEDIQTFTADVADYLEQGYQKNSNSIIGVYDMRQASLQEVLKQIKIIHIHRIYEIIDPRIWNIKHGLTLLITDRADMRLLSSIITTISLQPMIKVDNLDEGLTIISNMYPQLAEQIETYRKTNSFKQIEL